MEAALPPEVGFETVCNGSQWVYLLAAGTQTNFDWSAEFLRTGCGDCKAVMRTVPRG
jgi:hypothetical protein